MSDSEIRGYLKILKAHAGQLSKQQISTIRGQILAGDIDAALAGLNRVLQGGCSNGHKRDHLSADG